MNKPLKYITKVILLLFLLIIVIVTYLYLKLFISAIEIKYSKDIDHLVLNKNLAQVNIKQHISSLEANALLFRAKELKDKKSLTILYNDYIAKYPAKDNKPTMLDISRVGYENFNNSNWIMYYYLYKSENNILTSIETEKLLSTINKEPYLFENILNRYCGEGRKIPSKIFVHIQQKISKVEECK